MLFRAWISGLMLLCFISPSTLGEVRLVDGWTRSPAPGVDRLAIYGRLVNEGGAPVVLSRWVLAGARPLWWRVKCECGTLIRLN
jgi:hypothetical protein